MIPALLGLGCAAGLVYLIHKLIGHPHLGSDKKFFLWAEAVVFVLLCAAYVLGEAQKIYKGDPLGLHLEDAALLFAVLIVSLLIYKIFTRGS